MEMVALKIQTRLLYGITQSFHFNGCLLDVGIMRRRKEILCCR